MTTKRNRTPFILLVVAFVLPVLLAQLALKQDWFNRGSTNKGELIDPPLDFSVLDQPQEPKWRLAYVLPSRCTEQCDNALYMLNQVWVALGRESDRVELVVIQTEQSAAPPQTKGQAPVRVLGSRQQNVNQVFSPHATDAIFLVDTLGNIVLRYAVQTEQQQAVLTSRDMLSDVRKLLKLSRIG